MSFFLIVLGLILYFFLNFSISKNTQPNASSSALDEQVSLLKKYNFIREIAPLAQQEEKEYGLKSSLTLAQACLESDFGRSLLASKYHNLFGIKAYGNEAKVSMDTKEYENEQWITIKGDFRVYANWSESVVDHTRLFVNGVSWDHAKYYPVLRAKNYQQAAKAVQSSGYATDPGYADQLIELIQEFKLYQYDKV